jgi:hypothetical protein
LLTWDYLVYIDSKACHLPPPHTAAEAVRNSPEATRNVTAMSLSASRRPVAALTFTPSLPVSARKSETQHHLPVSKRPRAASCWFATAADPPPTPQQTAQQQRGAPRAARVTLAPGRHWTNPERLLLTPRSSAIPGRLYTIDRTYTWLRTFDVGARATVIVGSAPPGSPPGNRPPLLIYSPLPLTPKLRAAIDVLGVVTVIVAPNNEHVDFVASVASAYPAAVVLGPTGCVEKFPHLPFAADTFSGDGNGVGPLEPHPALAAFAPNVVPVFVPAVPFFNETVLLVRDDAEPDGRKRTLVVCDFVWNYPRPAEATAADVEMAFPTVLWAQAMNRLYAPVYNRVLVRDRPEFALFLANLRSLGVDRIIPCHGNVVESDGMKLLDDFFPQFLKAK